MNKVGKLRVQMEEFSQPQSHTHPLLFQHLNQTNKNKQTQKQFQRPQIHEHNQAQHVQKNKKIKKKDKSKKHKQRHQVSLQLNNINYAIEKANENQLDYQQQQQEKYPIHIKLQDKPKLKHLAICFPDSILELPQTSALRAYFISQIARISSIFKVDEIIILKDHSYTAKSQNFNPSQYLARNLQYLETPQYLRKYLFKMHPDLQNVGLMNPIQAMHHLKTTQPSQYREGVTLQRPTKKGQGSWVDIGLKQQARMDHLLPPNTRVTLRIKDYNNSNAVFYQGQAISKKIPKQETNTYWGYDVRIAQNILDMLKNDQNPYQIKILCNHKTQSKQLASITSFVTLQQKLRDKSMIIFFSGTDDLQSLIQKDSKAKVTAQQAIQQFNYQLQFTSLGVKQLRLQQQLFISLCNLSQTVA